MVKAVKGSKPRSPFYHAPARLHQAKTTNLTSSACFVGTLVECDPSIKSIIVNIDSEKNDYIIEDLDDSHLLIIDAMVGQLKAKLEERLKETVPFIDDDSGSDRDNKK
ncbi:transcription factor TFIIH complex subunit Tfb5-domain-containing protein [Xylaria palmicola]|nr:transcription factor TFIIH complex subunit Tfb5-domain-containing protein [Xylaria palmicola]